MRRSSVRIRQPAPHTLQAMEYKFSLSYAFPDQIDADELMQYLAEAGCTDALVGFGVPNRVGLDFIREAESITEAVESATEAINKNLPELDLIAINVNSSC